MPVLFKADGNPLTDAAGNPLKTGQTVTDELLGEGIVRGTVPLDNGEGLNVRIDWLGAKDSASNGATAARARPTFRSTTTRMVRRLRTTPGACCKRRNELKPSSKDQADR